MRRQDVGLQTHLDQLDRQISALQLDVRRGPSETADSDSRPSSGTPAGEPTAARAPGSARITEGSECFQCLYLSAIGKKGGFPKGAGGKEPACQCRRHKRRGFDPWAGKIPWRRARQPLPVFLPGEFHGLHSPWGRKESDMGEQFSLSGGTSGRRLCQCRRHKRRGFDPWVGKILWRRKWQPTPVSLPGKSYG